MNDNLNYTSEINLLKNLNEEIYKIFQIIFKEYCNIKKINSTVELCINMFSNPKTRNFIMTDGVLELSDVVDREVLKDLCERYIKLDEKINEQQKIIQDKIKKYELSIDSMDQGTAKRDDIKSYFNCLQECYQNYLNGCFEEKFTFKSEEMRRSAFHSINQEKEINISLSIPHDKVLHLMELPSPEKPNDFFSDLYNTYCKYFNDYKIEDSNLKSRIFMKFLIERALYLVNCILFEENFDSKYNNIINDILKKYNKEKIFQYIKKSFEKCINFRKFYEFKLIPEIILDYQYDGNHTYSIPDEDDYKYYRSTAAFTHLQDDASYSLCDLVNIFFNPSSKKYEYKEKGKLSDLQKSIIKNIFETFGDILNEKNIKKIRIEKENSKVIKSGCIKIKIDNKQYKYYIKSKKIASDLPIDILLLSYDETNIMSDTIISISCLYQAVILISYYLSKKLSQKGFKYTADVKCEDALEKYKNMLRLLVLLDDENYISTNYVKISKDSMELFDKKRSHLINVNLIVKYVNYFLKEDIELGEIFKDFFKVDLDNFCKENITDGELSGLEVIVNSFFRKDYAAKLFREQFDIVAYNDEGQKDEQPEFTMIMKLSQKLMDLIYLPDKVRKYDKTISMVGFSADKTFSYFGEEPIVNEVYAKTFMGKTVLQLLSDMRVKGRNYKLDAIYNGDMYNPIFYNLVTLKSFNPLYKEFINDILFKKKYNK